MAFIRRHTWMAGALLITLAATSCERRRNLPVEDLSGGQATSDYVLKFIQGTRDGDRLDVRVNYGNGSTELKVDLHFRVTPPTKLDHGVWSGPAGGGRVHERSTNFLGGQSGPPSIGGTYDLIGADERPRYRVSIPLQPLTNPL